MSETYLEVDGYSLKKVLEDVLGRLRSFGDADDPKLKLYPLYKPLLAAVNRYSPALGVLFRLSVEERILKEGLFPDLLELFDEEVPRKARIIKVAENLYFPVETMEEADAVIALRNTLSDEVGSVAAEVFVDELELIDELASKRVRLFDRYLLDAFFEILSTNEARMWQFDSVEELKKVVDPAIEEATRAAILRLFHSLDQSTLNKKLLKRFLIKNFDHRAVAEEIKETFWEVFVKDYEQKFRTSLTDELLDFLKNDDGLDPLDFLSL